MMMRKPFWILFLLFYAVSSLQAQDHNVRFATILDGDTVPLYYLKEVGIVESFALLSPAEIRKNQKLIRNVKLMLPFAKEGKRRLDVLEKQIEAMPRKQRKEAIKQAEKQLLDDYAGELKNYTFSQGLVLIKLIDRETGRTSYALVDELRGKLRASFYQIFARVFGYNLKTHYDPLHNKKDNLMERVVISVEHGYL